MGIFQNGFSWIKQQVGRITAAQEKPTDAYTTHVQTVHGADTPFGNGEGPYGGRTPYQSRKDAQAAAQAESQAAPPAAPTAQPTQANTAATQPAAMPQSQPTQAAENVIPFPNAYMAVDHGVCSHVEYVILLRGLLECKDVIAYMKTSASVFLNMEFISSETERQRCVDMLSGAACTLGCNLQKISTHGIYLISAPDVRVIVDPALKQVSSTPRFRGFSSPTTGFAQQSMHRSSARMNAQPMQAQPMQQPVQTQTSAPMQPTESPMQEQPYQQSDSEMQGIHPISAFGSGSPTTRFQAQGHRSRATYGSVMDGGMFPGAGTQRTAQ